MWDARGGRHSAASAARINEANEGVNAVGAGVDPPSKSALMLWQRGEKVALLGNTGGEMACAIGMDDSMGEGHGFPRGNVHSWTGVGKESVNQVNVNFAPDVESPLYQLLLATYELPFASYYLRLSFAMSQALSRLNDHLPSSSS